MISSRRLILALALCLTAALVGLLTPPCCQPHTTPPAAVSGA